MALPFSIRKSGPYTLSAGQTGPMSFDWRLFAAADMTVWRWRGDGPAEALELNTDYSISGLNNPIGGSVSLTAGALEGDRIVLEGARDVARTATITAERGVTPTLLNNDLDLTFAQVQEIQRDVDRAFKTSYFAPDVFDLEGRRLTGLPEPVDASDAATKAWTQAITQGAVDAAAASAAAAAASAGSASSAAGAASGSADAAEAARLAAEAAAQLALGGILPFTSRAAIKALDTANYKYAYLRSSGRDGIWLWLVGDFSAHVGYDTAEGLYMAADGVPATTGAWVRSYTGPALSSWFGVSSGAADNSAALSAWLKMLCEYNLFGHHNVAANVQAAVTCAPVNTDVAIMITADKRARITYTGAGGLGTLVNLNVDGIKDVTVSGLRVFGGDKCATGLRIEPLSGAPDAIIVRDCVVKNLRLVTGGSANGQGIRIGAPNATPGRYAEVTGCQVAELRKDGGVVLANSGISIVNFDNARCDHNTIEEVHHDGTNLIDADGISIFSGNVSSIYRKQTVSCQNNVLRNCAGRFIKLQTNGNALVRGNACHLSGAIQIITEWRWIDSQTGDCDVSENKLYADASWTGGGGDTLISLQTPTPISADNERVTQVARNNRVWTKKRIGTFFRPIVRDVAVDITWDVSGNQVYGPQALSGTTAADMGVNVTLVMTMVTLTAGGKYRLKFNDNTVQANTFISLAGTVSGDYYASTSIEACNNTMHPVSVAVPIFSSSSTWFTSALKMAGNNVGGTSGARIDQDIDLQYVLPGSEFYLGSGNYGSAPVSKTFRALRKQTRRDITLTAGTTIQASVDNGATWKTAVLS